MAMISIRMTERDAKLIRNYAEIKGISISNLIRDTVIQKIEDEIDVQFFVEATKNLKTTYSLDDLENTIKDKADV